MSYGRSYRKRLSTGVVPPGDGAWCVHCDGWFVDGETPCDPTACKCECHTKQRRPHCLCAVLEEGETEGCCRCCGCRCHIEEREKMIRRWREERDREQSEREAQEADRLRIEGVHGWEKTAFQVATSGETAYLRNYLFERWVGLQSWGLGFNKPTETGGEFIARIQQTPWGKGVRK